MSHPDRESLIVAGGGLITVGVMSLLVLLLLSLGGCYSGTARALVMAAISASPSTEAR